MISDVNETNNHETEAEAKAHTKTQCSRLKSRTIETLPPTPRPSPYYTALTVLMCQQKPKILQK